jgi:D-lactate dehydrogenase (cytochrome)
MESEHGPEALGLMRTLKRAIDPRNLMNPGKLIP